MQLKELCWSAAKRGKNSQLGQRGALLGVCEEPQRQAATGSARLTSEAAAARASSATVRCNSCIAA